MKKNKIFLLILVVGILSIIIGSVFVIGYTPQRVDFEKTRSEWCSYYYNERLPYVISTYQSLNLKENKEVNEIYEERYGKINFMDLYCN